MNHILYQDGILKALPFKRLPCGSMPPSSRTEVQPYPATRCAAARPPKADPSVKPQNIKVVRNDRRFSGQNSEVSVIAFGIAPPRPMPVRKRRMVNSVIDVDHA